MNKCGQCKQFTRQLNNQHKTKGLCAAWEQPTLAPREACDYFLAKKSIRNKIGN